MTKLEEEIISAFKTKNTGRLLNVNGVGKSAAELALAHAAAEVAKRYIEKALRDSTQETFYGISGPYDKSTRPIRINEA